MIEDMDQARLDAAIQTYYAELFDEDARLTTRSAQGRLELERTQHIVRAATTPPARLLDVGGGTGIHAAAFAEAGYEVVLVDPVESHVAHAARRGTFTALVGDARRLDFSDDSFDAVLMAGPLYHLAGSEDRHRALCEARRVCKPGGVVHAAAIPRFAAFAAIVLNTDALTSRPQACLDLLLHGTPVPSTRFPGGHFHTADELRDEMVAAGLHDVTVMGLEGPAGIALESERSVPAADYAAAAQLATSFARSTAVSNLSNHLLGTGSA